MFEKRLGCKWSGFWMGVVSIVIFLSHFVCFRTMRYVPIGESFLLILSFRHKNLIQWVQGWYGEFLLKIILQFLLWKTSARLNLKIILNSLNFKYKHLITPVVPSSRLGYVLIHRTPPYITRLEALKTSISIHTTVGIQLTALRLSESSS